MDDLHTLNENMIIDVDSLLDLFSTMTIDVEASLEVWIKNTFLYSTKEESL